MADDHVEAILMIHDGAKTHDAEMNVVKGVAKHLRPLLRFPTDCSIRHHLHDLNQVSVMFACCERAEIFINESGFKGTNPPLKMA